MRKYVTISVLREVKEILEKEKKDKDWSEFLLELYKEAKLARAKTAYHELRQILSEDDLESILETSKSFREGFKLR